MVRSKRRRERPGPDRLNRSDEWKDIHDHEEQWQPGYSTPRLSKRCVHVAAPAVGNPNYWSPISSTSGGDSPSTGGGSGRSTSLYHPTPPASVRNSSSSQSRQQYRIRQLKRRIRRLESVVSEFVHIGATRPSGCTKSPKPQRVSSVVQGEYRPTTNAVTYSQIMPVPSRVMPEESSGDYTIPRPTPMPACGVLLAVPFRANAESWVSSDIVRGLGALWVSTIWCCIATTIPSSPLRGGVPIGKPLVFYLLASAVTAAAVALLTRSDPAELEDGVCVEL
jgi:hypothetical protein